MPNSAQERFNRIVKLHSLFEGREVSFDDILKKARELWPELSHRTQVDYARSVLDRIRYGRGEVV